MQKLDRAKTPKKIATFASKQIGDTLLATPLYQAIRRQFPESHITLLSQKPTQEVLEGLTVFNEVIPYSGQVDLNNDFDLSILPVFCGDETVENKFNESASGVTLSKLYEERRKRWINRLDGRYCHWLFYKHQVELNFEIAKHIGYCGLMPNVLAPIGNAKKYDSWNDYVGVFITTPTTAFQALPNRQWPLSHWERLIRSLPERTVLIGSEQDRPNLEILKTQTGRSLMVMSSIADYTALCSNLRVLVVQDGGAMHLAGTTRVPVVALFGTGSPVLLHPWQPVSGRSISILSSNPCSPCQRSYRLRLAELGITKMTCMENIKPQDVLHAIDKVNTLPEGTALIAQSGRYDTIENYKKNILRQLRWILRYQSSGVILNINQMLHFNTRN